jgi:hypothetical protein
VESYKIPFGSLINVIDSLQDGEEIDDLLNWLQDQTIIADLFELAQNVVIWVKDENRGVPFGAWIAEQIENFLEKRGDELPDHLREYLENLSRDLNNTVCFLAGTQIEMSDGSLKNIENIQVGDRVKSYDESTKLWKTGFVSKVFHHSNSEMSDYYLVFNDDLFVTPNHPILVGGVWIDAGNLEIGDVYGGNIIQSIEQVYERVPTYNFEVEPYHTYNVVWGKAKSTSVVHNQGGGGDEGSGGSGDDDSAAGDKLDLSDICFLEGTPIAMADPYNPIKTIETIRPGEEIITYFPAGGIFNSTVQYVAFHREYEMIEGYVGITLELLATNESALMGAGIVPETEPRDFGVETFTFNVTPDHPLLVTSENPLTGLIQPTIGDGGIDTEIVNAGDIQPGMYTFGGKVISVQHYPNERKKSYHLITDNPYPYLIVAYQQEGMVQFLAQLIKNRDEKDKDDLRIAGMANGWWFFEGAFDKDEDDDGDDGDDDDGGDGDDDDDDESSYSIPSSAGIVYFYYNADLFDYRYFYAICKSKTNPNTYENYACYNWKTETTQFFTSPKKTLENQGAIEIYPAIT